MVKIKYRFEDFDYKYEMFIEDGRIIGDIIQAPDPLRYMVWDCEILKINDKEMFLKKLRPNPTWYRMISNYL